MKRYLTTVFSAWIKQTTPLLLLLIAFSSNTHAQSITETKTFNKHLPHCSMGEIIAKNDSKRACDRVSGKLNVKSVDCHCAKKTGCKTVLVASCTYDSINKQPLYKNKPSETFGIKQGNVETTSNQQTNTAPNTIQHIQGKDYDQYIAIGPLSTSKKLSCRKAGNASRNEAKSKCTANGGVYREQGSRCDCVQKHQQWECTSIRKVKCL